jgi:adenylate cyclase
MIGFPQDAALGLPGAPLFEGRQRKTIVVVDMVESVRLIASDESGVVRRWKLFTQYVRTAVLPAQSGHLVKSLGDGMMLTFDEPRRAVAAAIGMRKALADVNDAGRRDSPGSEAIEVRTGIHCGEVLSDDIDIYGHHANLAARIATLAGPGEIVISADLRDFLTDELDGVFEDLGECYLKHVEAPLRIYRVGSAGHRPELVSVDQYATALSPSIAIIPFAARNVQADHIAVGELIADGVIAQLGVNPDVRVISRLSATVFRDRMESLSQVAAHLRATYVLRGSYLSQGESLLVSVELTDTRTAQLLWTQRINGTVSDLLDVQGSLINNIAAAVHQHVLNSEVRRSVSMPLPRLDSCSLMLGAIALMHRLSRKDFVRSRLMLEHLIARHPRYAVPRAWLSRWYNFAIGQGWSEDPVRDRQIALRTIEDALGMDSSNALAWTIKGLILGYIEKQFDVARESYLAALQANPNEPLAWLGQSTLNAWTGRGEEAISSALTALSLSPFDPMKYYFDSMTSVAMLAARRYDKAIEFASHSLRMNRAFSSTYKTLAEAQFLSGNVPAARETVQALLLVEPAFTVERFRRASPLYQSPDGPMFAAALEGAGVPLT